MQLHVDDDGFVRAPAPRVYARLTDLGGWADWWPGVRATAIRSPGRAGRWALELADGSLSGRLRPLRVAARPRGWRPQVGFVLDLSGDLRGWSEFWLEPGHGGTVVHHVLQATPAPAGPTPTAVHRRYRRWLRRGLWSLRDDLHAEARADAGLTP